MSTLNTFGFSVRRKRNPDTSSSTISQPDKLSSSTDTSSPSPKLAFAATAPQSISTFTQPTKNTFRSLSKQPTTTINSKSIKRPAPKDLKQSTLAPFFVTPTSSTIEKGSNCTITNVDHTQVKDQSALISQQQQQQQQEKQLYSHHQQQTQKRTTSKRTSTMSCQSDNEEIVLCRVRRAIASVDVLSVLEEAFGNNEYGDINDNTMILPDNQQQQQRRRRKSHDTAMPLLQVKPNKVIYLPTFRMMDSGDNGKGDFGTITRHRRGSHDQELGNKRPCVELSCERNQQRIYSFMDDFDTQQQQGDVEIKPVRHCLSSVQMGSLLLDIANEFMTFDNNSWCTSYLAHPLD